VNIDKTLIFLIKCKTNCKWRTFHQTIDLFLHFSTTSHSWVVLSIHEKWCIFKVSTIHSQPNKTHKKIISYSYPNPVALFLINMHNLRNWFPFSSTYSPKISQFPRGLQHMLDRKSLFLVILGMPIVTIKAYNIKFTFSKIIS